MNDLKNIQLGKVLFSTKNPQDREFWIDSLKPKGQSTKPFYFKCSNCQNGNIKISIENATYYEHIKKILVDNEIERIGGLGMMFKISECESCSKKYYTGLGYIEPHNGLEIITLHNIVEIDKL